MIWLSRGLRIPFECASWALTHESLDLIAIAVQYVQLGSTGQGQGGILCRRQIYAWYDTEDLSKCEVIVVLYT